MAVPSPAVPNFTDGQLLAAAALNALGANATNLWTAVNGAFRTQKDCVIVQQTTTQSVNASADTLTSFNSASVNTNNMWTASQPTQITIQTAGIYLVFSQARWPTVNAPTSSNVFASNIMANGTVPASNTIASNLVPMIATGGGAGPGVQCATIVNLAVGATIYLDVWQNASGPVSTATGFGGTFLGAIFQTPSS